MTDMELKVVSIGHNRIDEQHRQLLSWFRKLEHAFYQGQGHRLIVETLSNLLSYMEHHFSQEEALMAQTQYPFTAQHKQLHAELKQRVDELVREFGEGKPVLSMEVITLLRNWLIKHINQVDAELGIYLK